jgi:hypothetical protein
MTKKLERCPHCQLRITGGAPMRMHLEVDHGASGAVDKNNVPLKIGDQVRIVMRGSPRARVQNFISDIPGGVVLDRSVDGTNCWNGPRDLVKV